MKPEMETYGDAIRCPKCNHEKDDSFDLAPHKEDFDYQCEKCSEMLYVSRHVSTTYTTRIKE